MSGWPKMNTAVFRTAFVLLLLGLWGSVAGCATKRIDWDGRIGGYTYDDAIRELGPPDKSAKLTDGSVVADWLTVRGMQTATAFGAGGWGPYRGSGYGHAGSSYVVMDPPSPDRFLRLSFDPEGKLASWRKVSK